MWFSTIQWLLSDSNLRFKLAVTPHFAVFSLFLCLRRFDCCVTVPFQCSNLMLVEQVRGEPLSFQVLPFDNPRLQATLKARSPQHKREWTLQIKRVILENYTAVIPNHARQLVLQLGQDLHETGKRMVFVIYVNTRNITNFTFFLVIGDFKLFNTYYIIFTLGFCFAFIYWCSLVASYIKLFQKIMLVFSSKKQFRMFLNDRKLVKIKMSFLIILMFFRTENLLL